MDCLKWVKRDSYLPIKNHTLKKVSEIKLGISISKENTHNTDIKILTCNTPALSVSTFILYKTLVHPFIFSLCTLIPLNPFEVLSKGSGTLCESLLISECIDNKNRDFYTTEKDKINYPIIIPSKKSFNLDYYNKYCQ